MGDKGALCRANFFQDVQEVTIDNPDCTGWGGASRTQAWGAGGGGFVASNPSRRSNKLGMRH